jgi:hypothetical protein
VLSYRLTPSMQEPGRKISRNKTPNLLKEDQKSLEDQRFITQTLPHKYSDSINSQMAMT